MNQAAQARIEFALQLVETLPKEALDCVLIGGSVAKGWPDDYSDLELCLCWNEVPNKQLRESIFESWEGKNALYESDTTSTIFEDNVFCDGLQVDVWHCLTSEIETVAHSLMTDGVSDAKLEMLWVLENGIVLKPSSWLTNFQASLKYSESAQQSVIERQLRAICSPDLMLFARRGDLPRYYGLVAGIQKRVLLVLYAINTRFSKGTKYAEIALRDLSLQPEQCWQRFEWSYSQTPEQSAEIMNGLIEELTQLALQRFPNLNLKTGVPDAYYRRQAWSKNRAN
ncbi:hypothetical protein VrSk94_12770 [Vibrio rotiferianus]